MLDKIIDNIKETIIVVAVLVAAFAILGALLTDPSISSNEEAREVLEETEESISEVFMLWMVAGSIGTLVMLGALAVWLYKQFY